MLQSVDKSVFCENGSKNSNQKGLESESAYYNEHINIKEVHE